MSRKLAAAGLLLVAPLALAGCSQEYQLEKSQVEQKISESYQQQKNVKPDNVTCPGPLKGKKDTQITCTITVGGKKADVVATVTKVEGKEIYFDWKTK